MTQSISAKVLDDAYARDPAAIHALLCNRVPCNTALAEDPHIACETSVATATPHFTVGVLGVINGVLAANGLPLVASQWVINGTDHKLLGFVDYVPPNTCTFLSQERKVSDGESCG